MAEFKIGDVVVLKSGGPKMTVRMIISDALPPPTIEEGVWRTNRGASPGDVVCEWFDDKKRRQSAAFRRDALTPCEL